MIFYLSARVRFFFRLVLINFIFLLLHRIFFLGYFQSELGKGRLPEIFKAVYIGLKFDMRFLLIVLAPLLIFGFLPKIKISKSKWAEKFWSLYLCFIFFVIQMFYIVDYGHFSYLKSRVNGEVLRFAEDLSVSFRMVWETYPVIYIMTGMIVFTLIYFLILKRYVFKVLFSKMHFYESIIKMMCSWILIILFWGLGIYGKLSYYPLRWSEAFFSQNSFVSSVALNPVLYFVNTFKFREKSYDVDLVRKYYPIVSDYLKIKNPDRQKLNFERTYYPQKKVKGTPNIVIVVMESMASFKTGLGGSPVNPTPYLDSMAQDSLYFSKFYVPSQATARSMFALIAGTPDVAKRSTSSRNPLTVDQKTIIDQLDEYDKYYFLGGSASWGNIRGILGNNIRNITIYEEGKFRSDRTDVWGISDYHLMEEANNIFKEKKDPFFAIIQTSGFHRPYTIPEDKGDFKVEKLDKEGLDLIKKAGFISPEEYNSMRFQDYSLGHLIELAKKEEYFKDTIFVVFGDHGIPHNNAVNLSEGEKAFYLECFNVPLLIYSPHLIEGKEIKKFMSELDIMPSIVSLLGKPYTTSTLGRDIFDTSFDDSREPFLYYWYASPSLFTLLGDHFLMQGDAQGRKDLHKYNSNSPLEKVNDEFPEESERMNDLLQGLYHTAKYMLYHNKN